MKLLLAFLMMASITVQAQKPTIRVPGSIPTLQGLIKPNTTLTKGARYYSADNRYALVFQEDGNLVIYKFPTPTTYKAVWNAGTQGIAIKQCVFQSDGNLVLYGFDGKPKWDAWTDAKTGQQTKQNGTTSFA